MAKKQLYSLDKLEKEKMLMKNDDDMPKIRSGFGTMIIDSKGRVSEEYLVSDSY